MTAYQELEKHFARINDLQHVQAITSWDEASMMPVGGGEARGRALTTLEVMIHQLTTQPEVADWIAKADGESLDEWQSANLRELKRVHRDATCMPEDLVSSIKAATSKCEQAWRRYRAENNWDEMQPLLEEVVNLSRQEATVRGEAQGLSKYDALLDMYEPDVRSASIDTVFADLKTFLPDFVRQVQEKQRQESLLPVKGNFSIENQKKLGFEVMTAVGFDFNHGRLDVSHHPFCGGVPDDVRITTRYSEDDFITALMAVIHESGHAMYEQGLPKDWRNQPVGVALSSGTHESQSLLMEMQACRTREFLNFLAPVAQRAFLGAESNDPAWSADNLYRLYTRVERGLIRVDADEVTYPLHVILRYELEKQLIEGAMEVKDLPDAWHEKMQSYLGLSTAGNFTDGCLQDVHWPAGLFGYFPTYTLGAMTAAQLFAAAKLATPNLLDEIGRGNFAPLLAWLRENVHSKGKLLAYDDLMIAATGSTLDAKFFKDHLQARYG